MIARDSKVTGPKAGSARRRARGPAAAKAAATLPPPPASGGLGDDIDWKARWLKVRLRVELPFWLMVDNTTLPVEVGGHTFSVSLQCETFELHAGEVSDSKRYVLYSGPRKPFEELSKQIHALRKTRPEIPLEWRKCKTVVRIETRCNADVWRKRRKLSKRPNPSAIVYLQELCRAHIPVLNQLIQKYRLATYDLFAFEVSPWDVPYWHIERGEEMVHCLLVPYRFWDHVPVINAPDGTRRFYRMIAPEKLGQSLTFVPTAGELELLDAMNFMQRGNYSDAVRRITTAIEAVVESRIRTLISGRDGVDASERFLEKTRMRFPERVSKYEALVNAQLGEVRKKALEETRKLRNRIVHHGYRIPPAERFVAEKCVVTGRWIFNWFEDDTARKSTRESSVAFRGLGRDAEAGVFRPEITPEGVVLSPLAKQASDVKPLDSTKQD